MEQISSLIQSLFDGPLDIVGDVHGEMEPLRSLLKHLDYSGDGEHHELIEGSFPGLDLDDIDKDLEHQNKNPVKLLSSGPEERTDAPIHSAGKIRHERRVQWWNDYEGPFCVFGHYSILDGHPRGNDSTFCIDYGVGKRWTERRAGKSSGFNLKLAALRWPERVVVFDERVGRTS